MPTRLAQPPTLAVSLLLLWGYAASAQETPLPRVEGPPVSSLHLLAVGDSGKAGPQLRSTLQAMARLEETHAILMLGDNVYECGVRNTADPLWEEVIGPFLDLGVPIYPVLGNHDWGSRWSRFQCDFSNPWAQIHQSGQPGYELWIFPRDQYVVETPVAEFIFLNTTPIAEGWDRWSRPLLRDLRGALERPKDRPWRIVVGHHPLHSCGDHGKDRETRRIRETIEPLLQEGEVDLYLSGHDHNLEIRTEPAPRPLHLISGAGAKLRPVLRECRGKASVKEEAGFLSLGITPESLKARFYCNGQENPCLETELRH